MVGIVIVSHSRELGEALVNLTRQMAGEEVPMAIAAGVGQDRQEFGTDAVEIMEAIQSVYSQDGMVILMDLGSAILSAEMAMEMLPEEMHPHIRFCSAPLVEGTIAAGVQASLGSSLDTVCREAERALIPKNEQLGREAAPMVEVVPVQPATPHEDAQEITLQLHNAHGLHARPAARFIQTAASYDADIQVWNKTKGKGPVSARSLNSLATLAAVREDEITVVARGPQADQALEALRRLVEANFGEIPELETVPAALPSPGELVPEGAMQAIPVSEGIAVGPLHPYRPAPPQVPDHQIEDPQAAWERLKEAMDAARRAIQEQHKRVADSLGASQAAIFEAHLLILDDPGLQERTRELIFQDHLNEAAAWNKAIQEVAEEYQSLPDPYLRQRAADVLDVGVQVLQSLSGQAAVEKIELPEPVILFAYELTPTQTTQLDLKQVLGLATVAGGPTSHSAILARAMGVPAVTGVDPDLEMSPEGTLLVIDGSTGMLWVDPPPEKLSALKEQREAWLQQQEQLRKAIDKPAVTRDGHHVEVAVNVGNILDAEMGMNNKAEGIGLLRTEFLFLRRDTAPSEAEQFEALSEIGRIMVGKPVVVRTLDVGGDKSVPYVKLPREENPFLGVRAIRFSLREESLFRTQLRAILRAGADHKFRVMFPMVTNPEEVTAARGIMASVHEELEVEGVKHAWPMETGIMVEIPSAALLSSIFAKHVDFFSIGTNDLTQYTLAAERGNPSLSGFADGLHPAVLRLIQEVVKSAHQWGKWVGVCGELAGDVVAVPVLVGLGVDELSMNPGSIPRVKALIRKMNFSDAQTLAQKVLGCESAQEVREKAEEFVDKLKERR